MIDFTINQLNVPTYRPDATAMEYIEANERFIDNAATAVLETIRKKNE